jgi:hypothetical protein
MSLLLIHIHIQVLLRVLFHSSASSPANAPVSRDPQRAGNPEKGVIKSGHIFRTRTES